MARPPFFSRRLFVGSALASAAVVCACGSRGPLDVVVVEQVPADAAADAHHEAGLDATADVTEAAAMDAPPDIVDAPPDTMMMGFDAGPLGNCGICLAQSCGSQLLTCVTSSGCTAALQCVATTCLTGGNPDPTCFLGCASDSTTQMQLLSVVGCILGNCSSCLGALSGLGGLGGGGGGG